MLNKRKNGELYYVDTYIKAEFDEDEKVGPYHLAASKVLYFDATQNHDNVIQVLFGNNNV